MELTTAHSTNGVPAIAVRRPGPPAMRTGPISDEAARLLAVVAIAAIAVVHILDAGGTYQSTRYIFWLYVAVIAGAIPVIIMLMHWASPLAWIGAALLATGPLVGYLWSRSIGLPGDSADIGNWLDTLGMASMFIEISVLSLSVTRLALHLRSRDRSPAAA